MKHEGYLFGFDGLVRTSIKTGNPHLFQVRCQIKSELLQLRRYAAAVKLYESTRHSLILSFLTWIIRRIKFFRDKMDEKITWSMLTPVQKLKFVALYLMIVFFAELFLRLTFEYLIAYLHMHEWLKPHVA